jgi:hypothetical protein
MTKFDDSFSVAGGWVRDKVIVVVVDLISSKV